jgi:hypothetical protein
MTKCLNNSGGAILAHVMRESRPGRSSGRANATDPSAVKRAIGAAAQLMCTDPPYGVGYDPPKYAFQLPSGLTASHASPRRPRAAAPA